MNAFRSRILLCASAAHCAQVLQAAAHRRVNVHGLQPCTTWPLSARSDQLILWALVPSDAQASPSMSVVQLEQQWRTQLLQGRSPCAVHMLYGNAVQQAQQLTPWVTAVHATSKSHTTQAWCVECVDAASEQQLFQHLLQNP